MKKVSLMIVLVLGLNIAWADDQFCQSLYDNQSVLAEPSECSGFTPINGKSTTQLPTTNAVTDNASFLDVGFVSDNFGTHTMGDLSNQTVTNAANPETFFAMDYDETATVLYAIDNNTASLVTVDQTTGTIASVIGVMNFIGGETPTGIAITSDGTCYASGTDAAQSTLYTCDLTTGALTVVGSQATTPLLIDIAASCDGTIYGHDIGSDSFYTLSTADGSATLLGPHGLAANFAQGMTYDREAGVLYAYIYTGGGTNTYAQVNTADGSIIALNTDNPQGEFTGASQTSCLPPPPPAIIPSSSFWSLIMLTLMLFSGAFMWKIRKA
jgi:hypothetical protein